MGRDRRRPVHAAPHQGKLQRAGARLSVCHSVRFGRPDQPLTRERGMQLSVVKNATCTFCGCVCDDIELHADGERITHTKAACVLGASWFKNHTAERLYPDALIDGKPATVDEARA